MNDRKSHWAKKTDKAVSQFTRDLLGLATDANVNFAYAGSKGNQQAEVNRVMKINADVVKDLMRK